MDVTGENSGSFRGWRRTNLRDLGTLHCGQSPATKDVNRDSLGTPYVTGPEQWDGHTIRRDKWTTNPKRCVPEGCIFITVKGAGVGKIFPGISCAIGRDIYAFEPNAGLSVRFIEHAIRFSVQDIVKNAVGDIPGLSKAHILDQQIHIPDLAQQERIVAEIEKQFSRLDEAVADLKRVKANLKRYKAAVLKAAVEGKLTEEWRKHNLPLPTSVPGKFYAYAILCDDESFFIDHTDDIERDWKAHLEGKADEWTRKHKPVKIAHYEELDTAVEATERAAWFQTEAGAEWLKAELAAGRTRQAGKIETVEKLLQRILVERRRKWEEAELARMRTKGKVPKDERWKDKYNEPPPVRSNDMRELPKTWAWVSWGHVGLSQNGRAFPSSQYSSYGVKLLRPGNLHVSGRIEWTSNNTRYMPSNWEEKYPTYIVGSHELLMNLTAQSLADEFLGRICLSADAEHCLLNQRIARLTPIILDKRYVLWIFKSKGFRQYVNSLNTGSLIQHMFTSQLADFSFPMPPLCEQAEIVKELERHFTILEQIEEVTSKTTQRLERIRHSVLVEAFAGHIQTAFAPNAQPPRGSMTHEHSTAEV